MLDLANLYFPLKCDRIKLLFMVGNTDIKVRPLKLAYLVDPNDKDQVREAIRLSSTLGRGLFSHPPIAQTNAEDLERTSLQNSRSTLLSGKN